MDCRANRERIAWMLRSVLINQPLPGVSVKAAARALDMPADTLRAKFRNDLPTALSCAELLTLLEKYRDTRLLNLVLPEGMIVVDMRRVMPSAPESTGLAMAGTLALAHGAEVSTLSEVLADGRVEEAEAERMRQVSRESAAVSLGAAELLRGQAICQPRLALVNAGGGR